MKTATPITITKGGGREGKKFRIYRTIGKKY